MLQNRGFTLIELLFVLVLGAILLTLATPSFVGYVEASRIDRAREQLMADLTYARMLAVNSGRPVSLCFTSSAEYMLVRNLADPTNCTGEVQLKRVRLHEEYRGVHVGVSGSSTASFTFDSRGLSRNASTQQVNVHLGSRARSFRVTPIGTVQNHE